MNSLEWRLRYRSGSQSYPSDRYFEEYREAWHLLRAAAAMEEETAAPHPEESAAEEEEVAMGAAGQRVQNSLDFFRRQLGKGGRR